VNDFIPFHKYIPRSPLYDETTIFNNEKYSNFSNQEYGNIGAGASGTRASFSTKLSSPLPISAILGSSYTSWVDTSYIA
jgi:hypothetical protein